MAWWYWVILIGANTPLYLLVGWAIFKTWDGFFESVRYWITPDAWSWLRGEGVEDLWAELLLLAFLITCGSCIAIEHILLAKYVL